ncbi:hypothetical protein [Palleronia marisminoris]|uniref:hypothetical protein n=1 Tax=Palleronia marisminoris TaxID=315423 RepID=UPI000A2685D6|nr:hypothetical protein [Palleronia marisminoris]
MSGANNLPLLKTGLEAVGPVLFVLAATMAVTGWMMGRLYFYLSDGEDRDCGRGGDPELAHGVTLDVIIETATDFTRIAMPSDLYALTMYLTILPFVLIKSGP